MNESNLKRNFGKGYNSAFSEGKLTLGILFPIEEYSSPIPKMENQVVLAKQAEKGGFAAVWSRDVPLFDPSFGDVGQMYDPWVWLSYIASHTSTIALGSAAIILPLRNKVDLAKSAASVDQLSNGRLIMGVASGDRPVEYSVYDTPFESRDEAFRETIHFIHKTTHRPENWNNQQAIRTAQVDLLPKSYVSDIPLLVTGNSRQSLAWIAEHSDGWLMYPRAIEQQRKVLEQWHAELSAANQTWKPFSQSLYIDLAKDPDAPKRPIHLGYHLGRNTLIEHLRTLQEIGVNHVTFNIKYATRPAEEVLSELCEYVVPQFPTIETDASNL